MGKWPAYRTLIGMSDGSQWVVVSDSTLRPIDRMPGTYAFDVEVPTYRLGIRRGVHLEKRHLNLRQMCWAKALS